MPTYEYRRPDGSTFEVFQKISAPALTHDPDTGEPVQRVISGGAGLQFKGDGFYLTDYARKGKTPEATSGESNESSGDSKQTKAKKESPSKPAKASGGASSGNDA